MGIENVETDNQSNERKILTNFEERYITPFK